MRVEIACQNLPACIMASSKFWPTARIRPPSELSRADTSAPSGALAISCEWAGSKLREQPQAWHLRREEAWQEGGFHHGQPGEITSGALPGLAHPCGAPDIFWAPWVPTLGHCYSFWASTVETYYCRELKLEDPFRYRGRGACVRFHGVTPGVPAVADDRARAFQDPTLMWWDETAQFL